MAHIIFEIGRYSAFLGVFFFALFGISLWMFRRGLAANGLDISASTDLEDADMRTGAIGMSDTVLYLRARAYEGRSQMLEQLGQSYRARIVWPFYLGVWSFCLGLLLMSVTFGFVLFE